MGSAPSKLNAARKLNSSAKKPAATKTAAPPSAQPAAAKPAAKPAAQPAAKPATGDDAPTALELRMMKAGCEIPQVHERGITIQELRLVREHVQARCETDGWQGLRPDGSGKMVPTAVKPEDVNLYDVNEYLLKPATKDVRGGRCSLVERLASGPRKPLVFLSHAWSHPFFRTVEIIEQHMVDREYADHDAVWICAFAIRQNDPGAEIPDHITESPFFLALRVAQMTLIVMGEQAELLGRMWCGLEAHLSMVEGNQEGRTLTTDIYTKSKGKVERLTDGFIRADVSNGNKNVSPAEWGRPHLKKERDARFPLALVGKAMQFTLAKAATSEESDATNILKYVRAGDGGETVVNCTFRARSFISVLPLLQGELANAVDAEAGFKALKGSVLTKLPLSSLPQAHTAGLLTSLPLPLMELIMANSKLDDGHAATLGAFLKKSNALRVLRLGGNKITHVGCVSLAEALKTNTSLTLLNLGSNKVGSDGVVAIANALMHNAKTALRVLWIDENAVGKPGGVALGKAMVGNTSLIEMHMSGNDFGSEAAEAFLPGLKAHPTLVKFNVRSCGISEEGQSSLKKAWGQRGGLLSV